MTKSRSRNPPLGHGALASLRVPRMDTAVIAVIDALEAVEAATVAPIRDGYEVALDHDIDPHAVADAAISPELMR